MFNKLFKGPYRIQKIISIVLIGAVIIGSLIWFFVEKTRVDLIYSEWALPEDGADGLLQNQVWMAVFCAIGLLSVALLIVWLKPMMNKSGKILKVFIVVQAFILLGVILIWCVSDAIEILKESEEQLNTSIETIKAKYGKGYFPNGKPKGTAIGIIAEAIAKNSNMETNAICVHMLTVMICVLGVGVLSLALYGLVDGFGRIVCSLERIAENSKVNADKKQDQCICDIEGTDCHTSLRTGSQ